VAYFKFSEDEYYLQAPEWLKKVFPMLDTTENGIAMYVLGPEEKGWDAPAVSVLEMEPNYTLFKHAHPCYRFEIICRGEMTNEHGVVLKPGDVMFTPPMEAYGPHTAGPEGCVTLEVFAELGDAMRVFTDDKDGNFREFDARKGEIPEQFDPIVREAS
jgi:hypothetical protein